MYNNHSTWKIGPPLMDKGAPYPFWPLFCLYASRSTYSSLKFFYFSFWINAGVWRKQRTEEHLKGRQWGWIERKGQKRIIRSQITIPQTFHFCSWWAKFVLMMRKWFAKVFRLCAWVADSFLRVIHKQIWFHLIQANSSYRRLFLENALAD